MATSNPRHLPRPKRCIVYTRHKDGGVDICTPGAETLYHMQHGGCWWAFPFFDYDEQVYLQMQGGIREDHAVQFARAITRSGLSEREAIQAILGRDCARHGHSFDLVDVNDIPKDRWFRDAWRQGHNGGPPRIDLELARPIQWDRMFRAVQSENKLRRVGYAKRKRVPFREGDYRKAIANARDTDELRRIWPEGVLFHA